MVDLTEEMAVLWKSLDHKRAMQGRKIMFVAAKMGEGVSTVAREFARIASVRSERPVWLIDADLSNQTQLDFISSQPERFGRAGEAVAGSPDGSSFFGYGTTNKELESPRVRPAKFLMAKPFMGRRLYVTHISSDGMIEAVQQPDYWSALAAHAGTIVVDVAAPVSSKDALTLAPYMDDIVIVLSETADMNLSLSLKQQVEDYGGVVTGLVINKAKGAGSNRKSRR